MSIRTSLLSTARVARQALPVAQIAPRRAASTAHKGSSNMPWALGSAAVFGSLTAFILMPSGDKAAHGVHEHIDAKGAGAHVADGEGNKPVHEDEEQGKARDLVRKERESGDRAAGPDPAPKDKPVHSGEDRPRTEIPSKRDDQKPARGPSTGEAFNGRVDKDVEGDGAAQKSTGGNKGSDAEDKVKEGVSKAKESASSAADQAKDKASSAVDQAKEKASSTLDKAKDTAGSLSDKAKAAAGSALGQAKEAIGSGSSSKSSTSSAGTSSSDSSTPSNVDDSGKPSDSDIKDSIKQAERSNSPLATMAEEVDESKQV